jgi:hypothetical protein
MDAFWNFIVTEPTLALIYQIARGVIVFLDFVFLAIIIYSLYELLKYRPTFVWDPRDWQKHLKANKKKKSEPATPVVTAAWTKMQAKLRDRTPDSLRLAIIEADGIVDEVLKRMGLSGETFADRLGRLNPEHYTTLDRLWDAHRVRNNLVHTPDFQVSTVKAEEAIAAYEAFLKDVKAL